MGWTQPQCGPCWMKENPGRQATALIHDVREDEICCTCGMVTHSGIYVRKDPKLVPYPTEET